MKNEQDDEKSYALEGALAGVLPAAAHLDYEARQLPGHRRDIRDLVSQAAKENRILAIKNSKDPNLLRSAMQTGDIIQQAHPGMDWKKVLKSPKSIDMTSLSMLGSGSAYPHVAMSTANGRGIDMGSTKKTPHRLLLDDLVYRLKNKGKAMPKETSVPFRAPQNVHAALGRVATDPFLATGYGDMANATVIRRLHGMEGVDKDKLAVKMLEQSRKPYSRGRATISGLMRMLVPGGEHIPGPDAMKGLGTFCSDGVCSVLGKDVKVPGAGTSMPHTVATKLNSDLVGIGLNSKAMRNAAKGLRGGARLESAALNTLNKSLNSAAGLRRLGAGGLIAAMTGAGSLIGSQFHAKKDPDES